MFVRDAGMPRVFLGPIGMIFQQKLLCVEGQIPIKMPDGFDKTSFPVNGFSGFTAVAQAALAARSLPANTAKIPRPPNAFIIYRKHWHSQIVALNPGVHNNKICMY